MKFVTGCARWFRCLALPAVAAYSLSGCDAFHNPDERTARASQMIVANQYAEAIIELKNALQEDPSHIPARLKLAEVELHLGDVTSAEKDLRHALALGAPPAANAELIARTRLALGESGELLAGIDAGDVPLQGSALAYYRGRALLDLRQYAEARQLFESIAESDARFGAARVGLSETHAATGNVEAALAELDRLIERDPKSFDAWLERGTLHAKRGEFAAASDDLQRARALPNASLPVALRARLLASLCEVLLAQADAEAANGILQDLVAVAPDAMVTQVLTARSAMASQDYAAAVAVLQRALVVAPELTQVRFLLGAALFAQGNLGQAELQLTQVLQRAPENLEARKLLAQVQLRLNRPDAVLQLLGDMQTGGDAQLERLMGFARLQQGEDLAGVAHLERAVASAPDDVNIKLDLVNAYLRAGRTTDAAALLSKLDSSNAGARQVGLMVATYEAAGDHRAADVEVERVIAQRPRDAQTLELASSYFAYRRDFARARDINQRAIALAPKEVGPLLVRANIEAHAGDLAAAESWLAKAQALDSTSAATHVALARLAARRGDASAAARALEDLRKGDPFSIEARLQLAEIYLKTRNNAAAKPVVEELKKLGESRPEILNALGRLYLENGRYGEALLNFQGATAQVSSNPIYWLDTARAQISLGNIGVAREALEKALAAQPGWVPAVGTLAMLDVQEGKPADAISRVNALVTAHPRDVSALALQGDLHMVLKDYARASTAYETALAARGSAHLAARSFKAREMGNLAHPTAPVEIWLESHPDDDGLRLLLADAYQRSGERKRAVAQYELIRERGAATPVVLNNLAWLYYELGDPRAQSTARLAFEAAPQAAAIADTYGWILVENGKAAEALDMLKRASAELGDPSADYHYAVALMRTGSIADGRKRLKDILARSPDFPAAADARKLAGASSAP